MVSCADALAKTGCENVETTVLKRRVVLAGFVAHMGNDRLPKRVMSEQPRMGGKVYLRGQEKDWMGRLKRDALLLTFPSKRNNGR